MDEGRGNTLSLAERLLSERKVTDEELERARVYAEEWGTNLSEALVARVEVPAEDVAAAEAADLGLECLAGRLEEIRSRLDIDLLREIGRYAALRLNAVPLERDGDSLTFLTVRPENRAARSYFREELDVTEFTEILITYTDIVAVLQSVFEKEMLAAAVAAPTDQGPGARLTISGMQIAVGSVAAAIYLAVLLISPLPVLRWTLVVLAIGYVSVFAFRFLLAGIATIDDVMVDVTETELAGVNEPGLPLYTILLPLYREADAIPQLVEGIEGLDYPKHKIDVIVLIESDDEATGEALADYGLPRWWTVIRVPPGEPRTKPKACNYGMLFARGQYLVVYDAEDLPESDQLKKAVLAFGKANASTICFQCLVTYYNRSRTLLSRLFTLEHWYWFDVILPGLAALGMPIPLGGTSNHFHLGKLRAMGGWDAWNLTEDADLSVRISIENQRVSVLRSTTREEANPRTWNWVRQRSRWMKGYLQTVFVHMRNPFTAVNDLGIKATLSLLLFVGGTPFVFLLAPLLFALIVLSLFVIPQAMIELLTPILIVLLTGGFMFAGALGVYMHMYTAFRRNVDSLVPVAILTPVYWILHSIAAYRALGQLIRRPHYWEKTDHFLEDSPR